MEYNFDTKQFKRENWKEYFKVNVNRLFVRDTKQGAIIPRFYLPVEIKNDTVEYECWIFLLAPIVWLIKVIINILLCLWRDMFDWLKMLKLWRNSK
jgi:hypothetical protein